MSPLNLSIQILHLRLSSLSRTGETVWKMWTRLVKYGGTGGRLWLEQSLPGLKWVSEVVSWHVNLNVNLALTQFQVGCEPYLQHKHNGAAGRQLWMQTGHEMEHKVSLFFHFHLQINSHQTISREPDSSSTKFSSHWMFYFPVLSGRYLWISIWLTNWRHIFWIVSKILFSGLGSANCI